MTDYVIITAGGKGLRMGSDIPKQFLPIGGRPVLMRTIERFREYSAALRIILVLPKAQQDYWLQLCREYDFPLPASQKDGVSPQTDNSSSLPTDGGSYLLADGGETRFHSVQNGLALIPDDATEGVVGVHDGVRPFPAIEVIRRCYETARTAGAAIPVIPVVETLRHVLSDGRRVTDDGNKHPTPDTQHPSKTVPRSEYRLVQTPQCFDVRLLKAANRQPYSDRFTDDASIVESYGHAITLVDGNRENIKITTPFDLKTAEALLHD